MNQGGSSLKNVYHFRDNRNVNIQSQGETENKWSEQKNKLIRFMVMHAEEYIRRRIKIQLAPAFSPAFFSPQSQNLQYLSGLACYKNDIAPVESFQPVVKGPVCNRF